MLMSSTEKKVLDRQRGSAVLMAPPLTMLVTGTPPGPPLFEGWI